MSSREGIKTNLREILASLEFRVMNILGKSFGISIVVRYLRNPNPHVTRRLLRSFGATVGEETTFKRSVFIDNSYEDENSKGDFRHLRIGNNCYIGDCVYFDLSNEVLIEDNAVISGRASFVTHADCNRSKYLSMMYPRKCQPVKIERGAWLGFGATVLAGVTVGYHTVIVSNALLNENAEPNSVYAGIPAKKVKELTG